MIIGIGGASRSGKTSLALSIQKNLEDQGQTSIVISQDTYIFDEKDIPKVRDRIDWEHPESIDFEGFKDAILHARATFSHVIAEGLFCFYDRDIVNLFDKKYFIDISKDTFLKRKSEDTRWGFEPAWYIEHIWKSYLKYGRNILENPHNLTIL